MDTVIQCVLRGDGLVDFIKEIKLSNDVYTSISSDGYFGIDFDQAAIIGMGISSLALLIRDYIKSKQKKIELNINGHKVVISTDKMSKKEIIEIITRLLNNG